MRKVLEKLDGAPGTDIGAIAQDGRHDARVERRRRRAARSTARCSCRWARRRPARSELTLEDWTAALEARLKGVQARGKAEPGDKTMVDALLPARRGAAARRGDERRRRRCARSADAAEEGMKATIPLEARKGRASYLGQRSVGPPGPGRDIVAPAAATRPPEAVAELVTASDSDKRGEAHMAKYAAALDQGTTSTRCMMFDHGGQGGRDRAEGARADLPEAGLGRARREGDLGSASQEVMDEALEKGRRERRRRRRRWASPTSARPRWCGTGTPASRSITRSSGRTRAPTASSTSTRKEGGQDRFRTRPACRWRPTSRARRSAGSSTTSTARARARRGRRPAVRQHGHLVHLEPHRRHRRRPAHHRCRPTPAARC